MLRLHRPYSPLQRLQHHSTAGDRTYLPRTVAEVKGIYAGLVMAESKCIEVEITRPDPQAQLHME